MLAVNRGRPDILHNIASIPIQTFHTQRGQCLSAECVPPYSITCGGDGEHQMRAGAHSKASVSPRNERDRHRGTAMKSTLTQSEGDDAVRVHDEFAPAFGRAWPILLLHLVGFCARPASVWLDAGVDFIVYVHWLVVLSLKCLNKKSACGRAHAKKRAVSQYFEWGFAADACTIGTILSRRYGLN